VITQVRCGVVKSIGEQETVKPRFMSFEKVKDNFILNIMLDKEAIQLHIQGEMPIHVGDLLAVGGQVKKNKFNAWAYKNLNTDFEGGVYIRKRLPVFNVLAFFAGLFALAMIGSINFTEHKIFTANIFLFLFIFTVIQTCNNLIKIYFAHKKIKTYTRPKS